MDVKERFLKYVSFETTSDENSETCPSSEKEKVLAAYLKDELEKIGLKDAVMDEYGYVYAVLPESQGCNDAAIGLIAHMDTAPDASGKDVSPEEILYDGTDITLKNGEVISSEVFPNLKRYQGEKLLITDGTTLLGADDKAGIAEIVSAMEYLAANPQIRHRRIYVAFTPDEEIGRGTEHFDLERFAAEYAYTVDGGTLGEIEYENFNAASVKITIRGTNIHPGEAKGKMKNAVLIGNEIISSLPGREIPALTEGYEGFYHVRDFSGNESQASIGMIIRDHDTENFKHRKNLVKAICWRVCQKYGEGSVSVSVTDSYYNMKEKIEPHMYIVDNAKSAMDKAGVEWKIVPIRGGTDGAMLSYEGLPCPNLCTGGENFHSVFEYIPVRSMEKMTEVIINICTDTL